MLLLASSLGDFIRGNFDIIPINYEYLHNNNYNEWGNHHLNIDKCHCASYKNVQIISVKPGNWMPKWIYRQIRQIMVWSHPRYYVKFSVHIRILFSLGMTNPQKAVVITNIDRAFKLYMCIHRQVTLTLKFDILFTNFSFGHSFLT